jgi:FtsP/CotA-like multicopper oxidase with cupredoxin domain
MRLREYLILPLLLTIGASTGWKQNDLPVADANDNREPAGTLRNGVLTIALDAQRATWHPDGDSLPGIEVEVFGETGRKPSAPGPLVRVRAGTEIRASVRNSLLSDTITFFIPARIAGAFRGGALDSVVVLPGDVGEIRIRAERPGNYMYYANGRSTLDRALRMRGLLAGAIVVDSAGSPPQPRDRVFVILDAVQSVSETGIPDTETEIVSLNGRSWPHTERLNARVGDTLVFRVINASPSVHPMHLHGFYFRVHEFDGPPAATGGRRLGLAVTKRLVPFTSMTMSWVPERAGNWLFHCHYQPHARPHRTLGATASRPHTGHENHALTEMGGMVIGIHVRPRSSGREATAGPARRHLRLVAVADSGFPREFPSMRFLLEDRASGQRLAERTGFSPTIDLTRGEPVSINVVNHLREPLSVHWHGIELESFYDGVAGFAGADRRLAPLIAAGDSFEVRMTPPRSGTFIYHSHVDEIRHHRAGLAGALVVRERNRSDDLPEHIFFIKSARNSTQSFPMEVNGQVNPDTVVLKAGRRYRFRFVGLSVTSPNATVYLTTRPDSSLLNLRDTMLVQWRTIAKDGADLPVQDRVLRPAAQTVSIGETYDIEFQPAARGQLRLEVRPPTAGRLFVRVPVRVE